MNLPGKRLTPARGQAEQRISKEPPPVIIPAWLDDAGLRPAVFRVLCRIARRGECFESLDSIANGCRIRRPTVQAALLELIMKDLVVYEVRPGKTNIYRLAEDLSKKRH